MEVNECIILVEDNLFKPRISISLDTEEVVLYVNKNDLDRKDLLIKNIFKKLEECYKWYLKLWKWVVKKYTNNLW